MRSLWLKLLLLLTFAYWATGTAKFVHEATEHAGPHNVANANGVDDDDDDDVAAPVATAPLDHSQPIHHSHPCPVCQMLAAMAVDQPDPAIVATPSLDLISTLRLIDRDAPIVRPAFTRLTTGPPLA